MEADEKSLAPKAVRPTNIGRRYLLALDGTPAGYLHSLEGGEITGQVVDVRSGTDPVAHKHIAGIKYEDFTFQADLSLTKDFYSWITDSWSSNYGRKDGTVVTLDYKDKPLYEDAFYNSLISEVTFPACDASSKDQCLLTVRCTPEYTRRHKSAKGEITKFSKGVQKKWLASNFRFEMGSLPCNYVSRIEPFTVKQSVQSDQIGERRDYLKEPSKVDFPNLVVTLAESHAKEWIDWHEDFVIKGNNSQDKELSGALVFLSADKKTELARISFFNVGIFQVKFLSDPGVEAVARVQASLYCDRMEFQYGELLT
jgi:hypothetical protein